MPAKSDAKSIHPKDGRGIHHFRSQGEFRKWLDRNCEACDGIWIKFAKKSSGIASVNYAQALDVALCYGWIDSQLAKLDERFYLQRFTPRGPRSKWSKINCNKVAKLIASGAMTPRGIKEIVAAKSDGRWQQAYGSSKTIKVPADFRNQLGKNPRAAKYFETISRANRYAILYRLYDAKKAETRQRRIDQFIKMLNEGKTIH